MENYINSCPVCASMKQLPGKTPGLFTAGGQPQQTMGGNRHGFHLVELPESNGSITEFLKANRVSSGT